LNLDLVNLI